MKKMMLLSMLALMMLIFAGCGSQPSDSGTAGGTGEPAKPAEKTEKIKVYYSDDQLMELVEEEHEITYGSDVEKYEKAIAELGKPTDSKHIALLPDFDLNEVKKDNEGNLTIDVSGQNQYNVGSSGEQMAIDALKKTLFQFDEVKSFVLLVDGKQAESLMGHMDISEPFVKE